MPASGAPEVFAQTDPVRQIDAAAVRVTALWSGDVAMQWQAGHDVPAVRQQPSPRITAQ